MKKITAAVLAALALFLVGCGGGDPDEPVPVTCTVQQCLDPK